MEELSGQSHCCWPFCPSGSGTQGEWVLVHLLRIHHVYASTSLGNSQRDHLAKTLDRHQSLNRAHNLIQRTRRKEVFGQGAFLKLKGAEHLLLCFCSMTSHVLTFHSGTSCCLHCIALHSLFFLAHVIAKCYCMYIVRYV